MSWIATHFMCFQRAEGIRDESTIHFMGHPNRNLSRNPKKHKQDAEVSDGSSDSDQSSQQPISQSTLNVPRFLVVKYEVYV